MTADLLQKSVIETSSYNMFKKITSLTLASASPRRLELLKQVDITPDRITPAEIDETPLPKELPRQLVERLAKAKAEKSAAPGHFTLAADTVVACGRRILGKAETEAQARQFLSLLSGRRHRVIGGIAVAAPNGKLRSRIVETTVQFARLTPTQIDAYIKTGEWQDKAGAYAIQGRAASFVKFIGGSYSNVVGLSLYDTLRLLEGAGFLPE